MKKKGKREGNKGKKEGEKEGKEGNTKPNILHQTLLMIRTPGFIS
jgi:hypothetical protein